jgi:5-methylcytosine-specific restriction endonuclease McrA
MGKRVYDWNAIQKYIDEGHGFKACHKKFGIWHATWVKAISDGRIVPPYRSPQPSYDWSEVQRYYDQGHTYRDCKARFGFCAASWHKAVQRGRIKSRSNLMPLEVLLATSRSRAGVRRRLLRDGIFINACSDCGLTEWRGRPISMHIDHVNGVRDDHRLENLRMLCPNCHSQTPTYAGRNVKRKKAPLQDQ